MENRKLRVVLFSTQWPEYLISLANSLCKEVNVSLILATNHRFTKKHTKIISKKIKFYGFDAVFYKSIRKNLSMIWDVYKKIKKCNPEIIHIQADGHRWFWFIYLLFILNRVKFINTIHDPYFHSGDLVSMKINKKISKQVGRYFTSKYIVHGEELVVELVNSYKIAKERIQVIHHGHFGIYKKFRARTVDEDINLVTFFGRIWPYKGLDIFIKAANIVSNKYPDAKFLIAGKGEELENYVQYIKNPQSFEIKNHRLSLAEADEIFQKSSFIVLPYKDATQSGVIPVAYAYSKPVIASNVGALAEVVKDGSTGFLVKPNNVNELAEKIHYLLIHQEQRKRFGENAYQMTKNELSWENIAQDTYKLYHSVL